MKPYFKVYPIKVLTNYPEGHHQQARHVWKDVQVGFELGGYDITFEPKTSIKYQVLAKFVVDLTLDMKIQIEKLVQNL